VSFSVGAAGSVDVTSSFGGGALGPIGVDDSAAVLGAEMITVGCTGISLTDEVSAGWWES